MKNIAKTFRLFVSSTFSDFQKEREILQTKVFPEIKEYCSLKGYSFQPIDLRWGVSNEAQLDQKALDMCIKEVQACKKYDYPNFLIMLGDRYGWIPLPNIIEKNEFELITSNIMTMDKELLLDWYYEDKNQIPISYILKQRVDKYRDYDTWTKVESKLRNILQNVVVNLDDDIKNKFFTSATESEAIEGIISYFTKTEYQKKLLELLPNLEQLDHKHIFGFFRDVNKNTTIEDKFISNNYEKTQEFKEKVKKQLVDENILTVNTSQKSKDKLDESYLEKFTSSVMGFLKRQIDLQITNDEEKDYSSLEIEKQQQLNFLNQKLENFLGQEEVLDTIQNYISNEDNKPLIICGQSGVGKSSIIAKVIENTSNTTDKKIIFRFIGATPNSTTTTDMLTSILEELNISKDKELKENDFIKFSDMFYNMIKETEEDIIIFLDALDQLTNDDQFLWIPNKLPANVKIVVSALKDKTYKKDSRYFYYLEDKISNYVEIAPFNKPIELLDKLLSHQNRTLQNEQKEYFLNQYYRVNTPLFVYMAANEIKYWKSSDKVGSHVSLSLSQKEIVKKFIENLTSIHHHEKLLIQKVFGYIIASKDGLSEYEILELLNTDEEFIKTLTPDTWHKNTTKKLPIVFWTRFYNQIKPFLSIKAQNGQELLYFFHREFIDVINNQSKQKNEHESIIEATKKLIEKHKDKKFNSNRWGKLYIILILEHYLIYKDNDKVFKYYDNILMFLTSGIILKYIEYINSKRDQYLHDENSFMSEHLIKLLIHISSKYKEVSDDFHIHYIDNLHHQATILIQQQNYKEALKIETTNIEKLSKFEKNEDINNLKNIDFSKDKLDIKLKWLNVYLNIKLYIGILSLQTQDKTKALEINKNNYSMYKHIFENNPKDKLLEVLYYNQTIYYAMSLQQNGIFHQAVSLLKKVQEVLERKYNEKSIYIYDCYAKLLYTLSGLAYIIKAFEDNEKYFNKSYQVYEQLLKYDFTKYSKIMFSLNDLLIKKYNENYMFLLSEHFYKYNIKLLIKQGNKGVEKKIEEISKDLIIRVRDLKKKKQMRELFFVNKRLIEYVFNFEKEYWAKLYIQKLIALGGLLSEGKIDDTQLSIAEKLQKEGIDICEKFMDENDNEWYDLYTININNLANTYTYLNKKNESYLLNKKNLDISTQLFNKDPQQWFRAYYHALQNMAATYFYSDDKDKEKEYRDKIAELEANPSFLFVKDVKNSKIEKNRISYFDFFYKGILLIGVYFFIKYVFLE